MNITIDNLTKSFGAVKALDRVSVQFDSGMIHFRWKNVCR